MAVQEAEYLINRRVTLKVFIKASWLGNFIIPFLALGLYIQY